SPLEKKKRIGTSSIFIKFNPNFSIVYKQTPLSTKSSSSVLLTFSFDSSSSILSSSSKNRGGNSFDPLQVESLKLSFMSDKISPFCCQSGCVETTLLHPELRTTTSSLGSRIFKPETPPPLSD
ncbi:hypothetical protein HID58_071891, partial [Brassica napus]